MKQKRDYTRLKHITVAAGLIILTALLQTAGELFPRPFGASAFLLIPAVVCCAIVENETAALLYGLLAGLLWDCGDLRFNMHAIFLCLIGCAVSAIIRRKMRNTLAVAVVLTALVVLGYLLADWLLTGHTVAKLLNFTLLSFVYTLVFTPLYYAIYAAIAGHWRVRNLA
ncbi:MAG: hypothetical protein LBJ12_01835 [Oscillospiraceae bacterium]|jgi:rod shape-determining protein MreD|nr:hypothetical protein [Oscillospiraceae bacterium]